MRHLRKIEGWEVGMMELWNNGIMGKKSTIFQNSSIPLFLGCNDVRHKAG